MSGSFTKAIGLARKLPAKEQEALGDFLLQEMQSNQRWAELFESSQDQLSALANVALAEHKAGKTKTLNGWT